MMSKNKLTECKDSKRDLLNKPHFKNNKIPPVVQKTRIRTNPWIYWTPRNADSQSTSKMAGIVSRKEPERSTRQRQLTDSEINSKPTTNQFKATRSSIPPAQKPNISKLVNFWEANLKLSVPEKVSLNANAAIATKTNVGLCRNAHSVRQVLVKPNVHSKTMEELLTKAPVAKTPNSKMALNKVPPSATQNVAAATVRTKALPAKVATMKRPVYPNTINPISPSQLRREVYEHINKVKNERIMLQRQINQAQENVNQMLTKKIQLTTYSKELLDYYMDQIKKM